MDDVVLSTDIKERIVPLPLHIYAWRRARERRLGEIRRVAEGQGWSVVGLAEDLSEHYVVAPLLCGLSAQAELACTGTYRGRSILVAYVDTRPLAESGRPLPPDRTALMCVIEIAENPRHLAMSMERRLESVAMTAEAEASLPVLTKHVASAGASILRRGDVLAAEDAKVRLVHPVRRRSAHVDTLQYLDVLLALATALEEQALDEQSVVDQ